MCLCSAALIPPKPGQVAGSPQLPHTSLLFACDLQSLAVAAFGLIHSLHEQEQFSSYSVDLRVEEPTARFIRPG